jgi:hypothetical protein
VRLDRTNSGPRENTPDSIDGAPVTRFGSAAFVAEQAKSPSTNCLSRSFPTHGFLCRGLFVSPRTVSVAGKAINKAIGITIS